MIQRAITDTYSHGVLPHALENLDGVYDGGGDIKGGEASYHSSSSATAR